MVKVPRRVKSPHIIWKLHLKTLQTKKAFFWLVFKGATTSSRIRFQIQWRVALFLHMIKVNCKQFQLQPPTLLLYSQKIRKVKNLSSVFSLITDFPLCGNFSCLTPFGAGCSGIPSFLTIKVTTLLMYKFRLQRKYNPCKKGIKCEETTVINYMHTIPGDNDTEFSQYIPGQSTKMAAQVVKNKDCCTEGCYSFSHTSKHMIFMINVSKLASEETELWICFLKLCFDLFWYSDSGIHVRY